MPSCTFAEYIEQEKTEASRHEYVSGYKFEMPEISEEHHLIATKIETLFAAKLREKSYQLYSFENPLWIEQVAVCYYPDMMIIPTTQKTETPYKTNPNLIIEIFSSRTQATDRQEKFSNYQAIPTLQEYILISEKEPKIEIYRKKEGYWRSQTLKETEDIYIQTLDLTISLEDIYQNSFIDD
ncbi:Uma2 family endonuclease [Ancylothrix sp. C2]|uniref:Uma2 family endonuclease n=1 Tax=Ancylothrix sp. D3o TaxID=2953691 RepID=UPI0021BB1A47|nr:Uma2 family endonuclease [Ancylothrix sp. D3o]MCT7952179.1 Uma2 family endonuclease [Ancylothrix sp. D3o]